MIIIWNQSTGQFTILTLILCYYAKWTQKSSLKKWRQAKENLNRLKQCCLHWCTTSCAVAFVLKIFLLYISTVNYIVIRIPISPLAHFSRLIWKFIRNSFLTNFFIWYACIFAVVLWLYWYVVNLQSTWCIVTKACISDFILY